MKKLVLILIVAVVSVSNLIAQCDTFSHTWSNQTKTGMNTMIQINATRVNLTHGGVIDLTDKTITGSIDKPLDITLTPNPYATGYGNVLRAFIDWDGGGYFSGDEEMGKYIKEDLFSAYAYTGLDLDLYTSGNFKIQIPAGTQPGKKLVWLHLFISYGWSGKRPMTCDQTTGDDDGNLFKFYVDLTGTSAINVQKDSRIIVGQAGKQIVVNVNDKHSSGVCRVFDTTGKLVSEMNVYGGMKNVNNTKLKSGLYIVEVVSDNEKVTQKVAL